MSTQKEFSECGNRAFFRIKNGNKIRKDKHHDLCFKCIRKYLNQMRNDDASGKQKAARDDGHS